MGNTFRSFVEYCPDALAETVSYVYTRRQEKRKWESDSSEEEKLMESLHLPQMKKLQTTAHYIYQALFVNGKDSDITVNILNKDWKLHKVYLGQSQYFSSMFSGSWNESNKNYISIKVEDPNITLEALKIVFGSFYLDEIKLEPCLAVAVLAASTMFQMDGLIEQCCEIMYESVSAVTAVQYYHAACNYGLKNVKEKVLNWFLVNFVDYYQKRPKRLKQINKDLMAAIVSSPDLCVVQTEISLYLLLRKWLYLQLHPKEEVISNVDNSENFFRSNKGEQVFLLTGKGTPYLSIFQNLRLHNLILNVDNIPVITADRIIPESWFLNAFRKQWLTMMNIYSGDKGISNIGEDIFLNNSCRYGRIIAAKDSHSWRWNGYSFGIDLVWSISENVVSVRRHRTQLEFANNNQAPHHIALKIEVMNLDEKRQVKKIAKTEIMNVSLSKGQEINILTLGTGFEYPMYVFLKLLITSKEKQDA